MILLQGKAVKSICCDVWMLFVSSTHIGLAFTFASFAIFTLRLSPDTICTAPDGQVPSQAPSFHRESRSTRGDGDFGNLRDFYDFIPQARAAAKRHAEEHAKEAARSCFFFLRDLYKQLLSGSLQFSPLQFMFHVVLTTMQATEVASLQLSLAHAADEDCCAAPVFEIHISAVSHASTRIFNLVFALHL